MGAFHFLNLGAFSTAAGGRVASSPGEHCVKLMDLVRANGLVFVKLKTFRQKNQSSWDWGLVALLKMFLRCNNQNSCPH